MESINTRVNCKNIENSERYDTSRELWTRIKNVYKFFIDSIYMCVDRMINRNAQISPVLGEFNLMNLSESNFPQFCEQLEIMADHSFTFITNSVDRWILMLTNSHFDLAFTMLTVLFMFNLAN